MQSDIELLREYVEMLKLNEKESLELRDWITLREELKEAGEYGLANYIDSLGTPGELQDLIVNTLYG
jgi:hypothetical protein